MKYVSVIVDNNTNATDDLYTYISEFNDIKVGNKVTVPFAKFIALNKNNITFPFN